MLHCLLGKPYSLTWSLHCSVCVCVWSTSLQCVMCWPLYLLRVGIIVLWQVDVNTEVGVVRDIRLKELRIYTDYGRCSRPLFIVEKQRLLIKKKDIQALQQRVCCVHNFFWHLVPFPFSFWIDFLLLILLVPVSRNLLMMEAGMT